MRIPEKKSSQVQKQSIYISLLPTSDDTNSTLTELLLLKGKGKEKSEAEEKNSQLFFFFIRRSLLLPGFLGRTDGLDFCQWLQSVVTSVQSAAVDSSTATLPAPRYSHPMEKLGIEKKKKMSREGCGGKVLFLTHCSLTTGNELQLHTRFSWLQRRWFLMISQFVGCMFKLIRGLERIKLPWCSRCVTEKQEQTNMFLGFFFMSGVCKKTLHDDTDTGLWRSYDKTRTRWWYFAVFCSKGHWCFCNLAAVMLLLQHVLTCLLTSSSNNWTDDSTIT